MCGRFALGLPVRSKLLSHEPFDLHLTLLTLLNRLITRQHDEIQQMHGYNIQIGEWVGQDQFVPRSVQRRRHIDICV